MLNHISIIGRIVNNPEKIKPASPSLHFIISTIKEKETFYFDIYVKRNIPEYLDNLKKGYQVAIEGNIIQI